MNSTLQKFITKLVEELKEENETNREYDETKQLLDIPFIISTLSQSFENNEEKYKGFIADLESWEKEYYEYNLLIENPSYDDEVIKVFVYPDWSCQYKYQLRFYYDERYWGYCQCTPDMPDYREDKQCCGHGCDTVFCEFTLNKIAEVEIANGLWRGDEHDYWEFEDSFYENEQKLLKEKERRRKESEIENLKNNIAYASEKLAKLEREYYEDRID